MLFIFALSASIYAQSSWKADPAHSNVAFTVVHTEISDVSGIFKKFDLSLSSNSKDLSDAKINFSIDVNSIDTFVEARNNHLKSADFFDAQQYGEMVFNSTSIKKLKDNTFALKGNLTMHGVTKPVSMTMVYRGDLVNPETKEVTKGLQVFGTLKKSDWGIGSKFPQSLISDEVRIKADFEIKK